MSSGKYFGPSGMASIKSFNSKSQFSPDRAEVDALLASGACRVEETTLAAMA